MENIEQIRALSWNQPFGTLMLHGKIETRKKPTKVRGKVLICTCKKPYSDETILNISGWTQMSRMRPFSCDPTWELHGYAIGIADLIDSRPIASADENDCFVVYDPALFCWVFANVQRIEPFKWEYGKQGWGFIPESEKQKIKILP